MHAQARIAGIASLCANQQDKFWPYHDKAFANQRALRRDSLVGYATDLGLDLEKFQACLDDPTVGRQIDTDMRDAQALGLTGTPAFLINGRVIDGARPFENFEKVFDEELKRLGITLKDKAAVEEISQ
ncbi:MAG: thioredoxin domain-containing protein [bacterium]|nr:thioredoxin domain-containing protein [bacterium]